MPLMFAAVVPFRSAFALARKPSGCNSERSLHRREIPENGQHACLDGLHPGPGVLPLPRVSAIPNPTPSPAAAPSPSKT